MLYIYSTKCIFLTSFNKITMSLQISLHNLDSIVHNDLEFLNVIGFKYILMHFDRMQINTM